MKNIVVGIVLIIASIINISSVALEPCYIVSDPHHLWYSILINDEWWLLTWWPDNNDNCAWNIPATPVDNNWILPEPSDYVASPSDIDDAVDVFNRPGTGVRIVSNDNAYWSNQCKIKFTFDNPYIPYDPKHVEDEKAKTTRTHDPNTGRIKNATISVNCQYFEYSDINRSELIDILSHEFGHALGFVNNNLGYALMRWNYDEYWSPEMHVDESHLYDTVYIDNPTYGLMYCCNRIEEGGPAELLDFSALYHSDNVSLEFKTLYEEDIDYFIVGRLDEDPLNITTIIDIIYATGGNNGAQYSLNDQQGEIGTYYFLESINIAGERDDEWWTPTYEYDEIRSQPDYEAMSNYNISVIVEPYWYDVANGLLSVPEVGGVTPTETDYLFIAYEDYVEHIAPLCDYWAGNGYDVILLQVDNQENRQEIIKNDIYQFHNLRNLQAVCLVGDACENNLIEPVNQSDYPPPPPDINHIPAFYEQTSCYSDIVKEYYATDIPYVDIDEDGSIDISIGRIPADNGNEVIYYVNKALHYNLDAIDGYLSPDYITSRIQCIPTREPRCNLPGEVLSETSASIKQLGHDLYNMALATRGTGDRSVNFNILDTTEILEWEIDNCENPPEYKYAATDAIVQDIVASAHVVVGVSEHFSRTMPYSLISKYEWRERTINRACYNYIFIFQCLAGDYSGTFRGEDDQPFCEYELFENNSLIVFGPNTAAWNIVNDNLARVMVGRIFNRGEDGLMDKVPIGEKWKECYNLLYNTNPYYREVMRSYQLLGDPMLYIRDVFVPTSVQGNVASYHIGNNYPNPFNPKTNIVYSLSQDGEVNITIYNLMGEKITVLINEYRQAGVGSVAWDGRDGSGAAVASGVYIARLETTTGVSTQKLVLAR